LSTAAALGEAGRPIHTHTEQFHSSKEADNLIVQVC